MTQTFSSDIKIEPFTIVIMFSDDRSLLLLHYGCNADARRRLLLPVKMFQFFSGTQPSSTEGWAPKFQKCSRIKDSYLEDSKSVKIPNNSQFVTLFIGIWQSRQVCCCQLLTC
jgi:hypothetical protein